MCLHLLLSGVVGWGAMRSNTSARNPYILMAVCCTWTAIGAVVSLKAHIRHGCMRSMRVGSVLHVQPVANLPISRMRILCHAQTKEVPRAVLRAAILHPCRYLVYLTVITALAIILCQVSSSRLSLM